MVERIHWVIVVVILSFSFMALAGVKGSHDTQNNRNTNARPVNAISNSKYEIVGGALPSLELAENLKGVVTFSYGPIRSGIGQRYSHCSGSYLGHGMLLTARHCLPIAGSMNAKISMVLYDASTDATGVINSSVETFEPPVTGEEDDENASGFKVKKILPDIGIIKVKDLQSIEKMDSILNPLPIVFLEPDIINNLPLEKVVMAGYGATKFNGGSGSGNLLVANPYKLQADKKYISVLWKFGEHGGGLAPGDSGSPLIVFRDGKASISGVASSIFCSNEDFINPQEVTSKYELPDKPSIKTWLEDILNKR